MQIMSSDFALVANSDNAKYYATIVENGNTLEIKIDDFKYKGAINDDDDISIGNTCSNSITFSIYNPSVLLENKEIKVRQGLMINNVLESLEVGYFTIQKPVSDGEKTSYTGYDRMKLFEKAYFSNLSFPTTTGKMIDEICGIVGVEFNATLPNTYKISLKPEGYTCREMIGYLAALYGANAIINRDGKLEFVCYTQIDYTLDGSRYYEDGIEINSESDFILQKITCSVSSGNDENTTLTVGTGTQGISIENPLMTQSILSEIYNKIKNFTFRAMSVKFLGDFRLDLGDVISVKQGSNEYKLPVMQIEHECDGGLISKVTSVAKTETEQEFSVKGPNTKQMERYYADLVLINKAMVNKLDAEEARITYATITNLEAVKARVTSLEATEITTTYLETNYAKINLANIENGCITSAMIGTGVVGTAQIADGSITDAKIVGLTANKITAGTLDAGNIEVINLNAANITVGTINGQQIAPGAVDVNNIADYAVTTEKIALGAVTATNIAAGCIIGTHISAGTISAEKLAIGGDLTDFITVNEMLPKSAVPSITYAGNRGSAIADGYIIKPQSTDDGILLSDVKPNCFVEGDKLYYKMSVKADVASSVRVIIFFYGNKLYRTAAISEYHTVGTTDTTIEGELTVPALTSVDSCVVAIRDYTIEGQLYVKNASCRRQVGSTYITDGAITTDKIVASAITGDKIAAQTITANNILAGTITAASGIIADINADVITTGTLKGITIQSTNYQEAVGTLNPLAGSKLNLADGSFKSRNLRWDSDGNVTCNNIKATSGTFTGTVNMKNGTIGEWAINSVGQMSSDRRFGTSTAGTDYRFFIQPIMSDSTTDTWMISSQYKAVQEEGYYAFWNIKLDGTATFGDVYASKYNMVSDKNKKHDIVALNEQTCINVICAQEPVTFKYNNTQYNRTQWGFIAQDVEEKLNALGITWQDFAVVDKTPRQKTDKYGNIQKQAETEYDYFLRYEAFIAPMIAVEKSHERRICELENELAVAKALIQNLMLKGTD